MSATEARRVVTVERGSEWEDGFARPRVVLTPYAAPSVLGLYGFAAATFMVALHLTGVYGGAKTDGELWPFAAMFGGVAQFLAGMWAYRVRDTIATAMHGMWGSFWIAWGILNLFLFFLQVWEVKEPPAQPVLEGRTVDVFVPTFNEDPTLLRATLEACVRMDYPHRTYVLDDGRRPEVEALARELGIEYIARPDNRHFKAGNLNYAFERTDGEFVVVLDADHVPEPHFITRLIGYFRDDRLGYVQTPHAFYNFDSFQARLDHANRKYWEEGHLFYYVIQPGRNDFIEERSTVRPSSSPRSTARKIAPLSR